VRLLHDISTVETPEQLEISLPLAGIGSRFLAYTIDFFCQLIPIIVALALVFASFPLSGVDLFEKGPADGIRGFKLIALVIMTGVIFATNFFYFALFEMLWHGQSPGKRALHLRVVRDGGYPIDGRAALIRNLLRVVDSLPAFYVLGVISIFVGRHGKRIGDYAAGTVVVKEQLAEPVESNAPAPRASSGLLPAEAALVEQFLSRMFDLEPESRDRLARDLANRLAQKYSKPAPEDAMKFLTSLLKHGDS
jgi:uncharacterized RDD family membrane protein YckC